MDKDTLKRIDKMHDVLFGDEEAGGIGMVKKVDAIYDVFVMGKNGINAIKWIVGSIIVIGIFVGTIKGWIVGLAHWLINK